MIAVNVQVKLLRGAKLPEYATKGAAAFDLVAKMAEGSEDGVMLSPSCTRLIPTGLQLAIPPGFCMKIYPRSGLATKHGINLANGVAVIDSDYRGEVFVPLRNNWYQDFRIEHGMRIAQGIIERVEPVVFHTVDELEETERGAGGFGSTGV